MRRPGTSRHAYAALQGLAPGVLLLFSVAFVPAAQALVPLGNIVQVVEGRNSACAITTAGGVKCWGMNGFGQLGDGTTTDRLVPVDVKGLSSGVIALAAGEIHTCALLTGGAMKCWGYGFSGQLGDNTQITRTTPVDVLGLGSGVIAIAAGWQHTCAVLSGGAMRCWGSNDYGQLGDGTVVQRLAPVSVVGAGFASVAAGQGHTCAVTQTGGATCWGRNASGQVGDNSTTQRTTPVSVSGLTSGVAAIDAGYASSCAVLTTGALKCWGYGLDGQLGDGTRNVRLTPVNVTGLASGVASVGTGNLHTCARTTGGAVKCWGGNDNGEVGDGTFTDRLTPVDVPGLASGIVNIGARANQSCAVTAAGGVQCWGSNGAGELGSGSRPRYPLPAGVSGLSSGVASVSAGGAIACALTAAGGVKCWGNNGGSGLGDGTFERRLAPVDVTGLTSGVTAIALGNEHACALTAAGGVKCWGRSVEGQIGNGSTAAVATPADVTGLTSGVIAIAAGAQHSCALTSGGGVKCWGANTYGEIGDGTTTQRLTAANVVGLASGVAAIGAGQSHTCAVTSAGAAKCWGKNDDGQLGDGSTTQRLSPVDVSTLSSGVAAISGAWAHTCARTTAGAMKCWGMNSFAQLGDNTTTARLVPVDVAGLGSGVAEISTAIFHTCARKTGGELKCWGVNTEGELGDGTTVKRLSPRTVVDTGSWIGKVAAGGSFTCAVATGSALKCWGSNDRGQLGLGFSGSRPTPGPVMTLPPIAAMVASSRSHTLALDATGKVYAWGSDSHGQLGQGRAINRPTPARVPTVPPVSHVSLSQHILAIEAAASKQVWSWGDDSCGQLGPRDAFVTTKPAAVTGVTGALKVASGGCFSLALMNDGSVWGWGRVPGYGTSTAVRPLGITGVVDVQAGAAHALVLKSDATVWAFGDNGAGQLGTGSTGPAQPATQVAGLANVVEVAAGAASSAVRLGNGQLWFWGEAGAGQYPQPFVQPAPPSSAVAISLSGNELQAAVSSGGIARLTAPGGAWQAIPGFSGISKVEGGVGFTLGIGAGGQVYAQGSNTAGQLGQGNTSPLGSAVQVPGMLATLVVAGTVNPSVLAMKSDGSLWFWGADTLGESGDGGAVVSSVPRLVNLPAPMLQVAAGDRFSIALDASGNAYGWGDNGGMSLDGTLVNRSLAAPIPTASNIQAIAAGGPGLVLYQQTDGGLQYGGTLGPGVIADAPTAVAGIDNVSTIAVGTSAYALRGDNVLFAFGGNSEGELGNGTTAFSAVPVAVQGISGTITGFAAGLRRAAAVTADGKAWSWGAGPLGNGGNARSTTAVQVPGIVDASTITVGGFGTMVRRAAGGLLAWGDQGLADADAVNALLPYPVAAPAPVRSVRLGGGNATGYMVGSTGLLWGFGRYVTYSNLSAAIGDGTYVPRRRPVPVHAVGGAGNVETNDWFLDLEPATSETIPATSKPKLLGQSDLSGYGAQEGVSLAASVKGRPADIGKTVGIYVIAFVPPAFLTLVKTAPSLTKSRVEKLLKAGEPVLVQLTPKGWETLAGVVVAYSSGVMSGSSASNNILDRTPLTPIPGARFCIGYGETAEAMLSSMTLREVLVLEGAAASVEGRPCLLSGVYVSGPPSSVQGSSVTFTASVVGVSPGGSVQFRDFKDGTQTLIGGSIPLSPANDAVAQGSIVQAGLAEGVHSIDATYSGDGQNDPRAAEVPLVHVVTPAGSPTTVALAGPVGSLLGETVTFTATVTGGSGTGTVQFKDGNANLGAAATLQAGVASLATSALPSGSRSITAVHSPSGAVSNTLTHLVQQNPPVDVVLGSSANPSVFGTTITLTATVSGSNPQGSVTFRDGNVLLATRPLASGSASLAIASLVAGRHELQADYSGDGVNLPASSAVMFQDVTIPATFLLSVAKAGAGTGTLVSTPAGINCTPPCSASFASQASVSLTAAPAAGSLFSGWSGACTNISGACQLTMNSAKSVTAIFNTTAGAISANPASLDFGGQSMNTTSPGRVIALANTLPTPVTVNAISVSGGFAVSHACASLAAGAACNATVTFTPVAEGAIGGAMTVTADIGGVAVPLTGTGEKSLVTHYYRSILRRDPDASGKTFWTNEAARVAGLGANVNEAWFAMAQTFFASAEYLAFNRDNTGFVTDLYSTFFNRATDGPGLAFWKGQLDSGMPREVVLAGFMFSTEFVNFTTAIFGNTAARAEVNAVMDFYRGLLARLPDDGGFGFWAGQFRTAQCQGQNAVNAQVEAISSAFALSGEYGARGRTNAQYVGDLYNAFLRRGGDLGGVQFWISEIATGARTRENVRRAFVASSEFQLRVAAIIAQGCMP